MDGIPDISVQQHSGDAVQRCSHSIKCCKSNLLKICRFAKTNTSTKYVKPNSVFAVVLKVVCLPSTQPISMLWYWKREKWTMMKRKVRKVWLVIYSQWLVRLWEVSHLLFCFILAPTKLAASTEGHCSHIAHIVYFPKISKNTTLTDFFFNWPCQSKPSLFTLWLIIQGHKKVVGKSMH